MAAGLALAGKKPYYYSMINFVLFRPYEQLRNDVCYGNLNVKFIGVRGLRSYKFLGISHNIQDGEDKAILSTLPNINSYFPTNEEEVKNIILQEYERKGPAYLHL